MLGKVEFSSLFTCLTIRKACRCRLRMPGEGIPVIAYGAFINDIINFIIVAFVVFLLIKTVNKIRKKDTSTKDCPHCLSAIPIGATRCSACCVDLLAA